MVQQHPHGDLPVAGVRHFKVRQIPGNRGVQRQAVLLRQLQDGHGGVDLADGADAIEHIIRQDAVFRQGINAAVSGQGDLPVIPERVLDADGCAVGHGGFGGCPGGLLQRPVHGRRAWLSAARTGAVRLRARTSADSKAQPRLQSTFIFAPFPPQQGDPIPVLPEYAFHRVEGQEISAKFPSKSPTGSPGNRQSPPPADAAVYASAHNHNRYGRENQPSSRRLQRGQRPLPLSS